MSKQFRTQRAVDVPSFEDLQYPLIGMPKIDGVYAINRGGDLLARSLKPFKNKYITEALSRPEFDGFIGELSYGGNKAVQDLCRNTTSCVNTIDKEWDFTWTIFDYVGEGYEDKPFHVRINKASQIIHSLFYERQSFPITNIFTVVTSVILNETFAASFYERMLEQGYEGAIYRCPDSLYKRGRSTVKEQGFLRAKPQEDFDAQIIDIIEAEENQNEATTNELGYTERSSHQENKIGKGMAGSFICKDLASGATIKVGAGKMTHQEREDVWENKELYIGKFIKYRSMTTGVKDLPRFPRFIEWRAEEDILRWDGVFMW